MKRMVVLLLIALFLTSNAHAEVKLGQVPPVIELKDELGGRIDGSPWSSSEMKGKVFVLFYVDPDVKDLNNEASEALAKEEFPRERFQSFAVINMGATWLPNFMISSSLKDKQKQYPKTIYVRDYKKVMVKKWNISDDNSDVLVFDKEGRLIFKKDGKLGADDIKKMLQLIKENL